MNSALQRLPRDEERTLLDLVRANGLDAAKLRCHMTRQQGHGRGTVPGGHFIRSYSISYNLMLCEDCGSAEEYEVCSVKARKLKEALS